MILNILSRRREPPPVRSLDVVVDLKLNHPPIADCALGLKGMVGAFDEAVTSGVQRKRTTTEILTDLLRAEAAHRHAASIRYRMSAAKLPVVKDIDAFVFDGTPANEGLVRSLHAGSFLPGRRNIVLVGGTGTGRRIWPSPLPPASCAPAPAAATSTPSTWSHGSRRRRVSAGRRACRPAQPSRARRAR